MFLDDLTFANFFNILLVKGEIKPNKSANINRLYFTWNPNSLKEFKLIS